MRGYSARHSLRPDYRCLPDAGPERLHQRRQSDLHRASGADQRLPNRSVLLPARNWYDPELRCQYRQPQLFSAGCQLPAANICLAGATPSPTPTPTPIGPTPTPTATPIGPTPTATPTPV